MGEALHSFSRSLHHSILHHCGSGGTEPFVIAGVLSLLLPSSSRAPGSHQARHRLPTGADGEPLSAPQPVAKTLCINWIDCTDCCILPARCLPATSLMISRCPPTTPETAAGIDQEKMSSTCSSFTSSYGRFWSESTIQRYATCLLLAACNPSAVTTKLALRIIRDAQREVLPCPCSICRPSERHVRLNPESTGSLLPVGRRHWCPTGGRIAGSTPAL